jgi:4-alpha-glucanotransferase
MNLSVRRSGLLIPLFSASSSRSWGIGDIGDIAPFCTWLSGAGQRILQLLPLNEMASGLQSPYSAMSAMAIDPIYICVPDVPEFVAGGGEASLAPEDRERLAHGRAARTVEYGVIRPVKHRALCAAFDRFTETEFGPGTARAAAFGRWADDQSWWLDDYALFRAVHERERGRSWIEWPDDLKRLAPEAVAAARRELARDILFYQYLQWLADTQWHRARAAAGRAGVALFGDLPFMVDQHSADVWTHQADFQLDRSVGVPPDAFSATGQDWGMPAYDWNAIKRNGFGWLLERARRSADLFDGYRVDHLVGFYRTYSRQRDRQGEPAFSPARQIDQLRLGERVLQLFRDSGADVIAEDLGTVPDFVRASLRRLAVPGYRVLRWEREWDEAGEPFRDPVDYPAVSVATTGTHDTETMMAWWQSASVDERKALAAVPSIGTLADGVDLTEAAFVPVVRDTLLEALFASGSDTLLLPVQDVFGWTDRINEPSTVSPQNWTYRLPWPVDGLDGEMAARERQTALRRLAAKHGRIQP